MVNLGLRALFQEFSSGHSCLRMTSHEGVYLLLLWNMLRQGWRQHKYLNVECDSSWSPSSVSAQPSGRTLCQWAVLVTPPASPEWDRCTSHALAPAWALARHPPHQGVSRGSNRQMQTLSWWQRPHRFLRKSPWESRSRAWQPQPRTRQIGVTGAAPTP